MLDSQVIGTVPGGRAMNPEELQPVLERMRRQWNERAVQDAQYYVCTGVANGDDFDASGRVNYEQIVRPFLPVLLRGRSPGECRVLEIGCGLGRMTACFAQEFQEVHALDVSPEMIARARERLRACSNVVLHPGSGMDLHGLPDGYFDLAFSFLVFQHIPSRDVIKSYVREAARVLRPGGAFHFQVNGYLAPEYRQGEKDTWLGESFSFEEAVEMLRAAELAPFNAVGAGTQYFILSARRDGKAKTISAFLLPGASPPGQLLEGRPGNASGDCRPVAPANRVLLALPAGWPLRLFLCLYCDTAAVYPDVALALDGTELGRLALQGAGDHYCEFPIPEALSRAESAVVTLAFEPAEAAATVGLRSMGIYAAAAESATGRPASARGGPHESERIVWIAHLEQECLRLSAALWEAQKKISDKAARAISLQAEIESKVAWARSLEAELQTARADLEQLRSEFEERTAWALSLRQDLEAARSAWTHSEQELSQCAARIQQLQLALRQAQENPWPLVGRKLRSVVTRKNRV